jgi:hypothetical protein
MKIFLSPHPTMLHLRAFTPAYNDATRPPGLTDDEFLERAIQRNIEVGFIASDAPVYTVEQSTLPTEFAEAWEWDGSAVSVNMTKARSAHMDDIRRVRDEELVKLDVPFIRAVEAGDTDAQATIGTEKQVLRDLPATFDITTDAGTPELLKAKWPTELPARE